MNRKIFEIATATMLAASMLATGMTFAEEPVETEVQTEAVIEAASEEESTESVPAVITCSPADVDFANVDFDYAADIAVEKEETPLVPEAAQIALTVTDAIGASGIELVSSADPENTSDLYLNTYVAGDALTFDGGIASAVSSTSGEIEVADGRLTYSPAAPVIGSEAEVITFIMEDGAEYRVNIIPEAFPQLEVTGNGVAEENAGVYTFALDHFMIRVNTNKEIIYYRNMNCTGGEKMVENFAPQSFGNTQYYSVFVELRQEYRNANGGYSSGFYLVMDENYTDVDEVNLAANTEANHTHGEGYLDQHEFVVIGESHYLVLSYTLENVQNLPDSLEGIDGTQSTYVWAGIMQEVKDGTVVAEIDTTDYPLLYESAVEKIDYANATLEGVTVTVGQNEIPSFADGIMDYVHVNSLDYTLNADGNVDKLLVSMRDQCAVYQFDMASGSIEWILGGKASTLSGYDEFTSQRTDDMGASFTALTYGQHFARYTNKTENGTIEGNPIISIFDNQTGIGPFITAAAVPTLTRVFEAEIDEAAKTANIFNVIDGTYLNTKSDKYHIASHCGSVKYENDSSVVIGWGLHGVIDNIGPYAPEGTISDQGYEDLRIGSRPIFTEYDMANDAITFELSGTRNMSMETSEGFFSYRTYKTVK